MMVSLCGRWGVCLSVWDAVWMDWTGLDEQGRAGPGQGEDMGRQGEPGRAGPRLKAAHPPPPCMAAQPAVFERDLLLYG
jgi:hypothetical protein